jgi:hypothetical protein
MVKARGKGNSPLADRWVPLTIEIRRKREGVPAGLAGLRCWAIMGREDQGGIRLRVKGLRGL